MTLERSEWGVTVARSSDVADGGRIIVAVDGVEIGIFRVRGCLYAWENSCAHAGGPVCQGKMSKRVVERLDDQRRSLGDDFADTVQIVCPWHGYEYDVCTGVHPGDPRIRLRKVEVGEAGGDISVLV